MNTRAIQTVRASLISGSLLITATTAADDLFQIDASTTSGPALNVSASGPDFPSLLEDAIRSQGSFTGFVGRDTQAALNYAGLANAVVVDVNAAGTNATLQIPDLSFARNFSGSNRAQLEDDIEAFLFEDGEEVYADFLELVRQQTVIDALDGNPTSVTGRLARHTMRTHTLGPWRAMDSGAAAPAESDEDAEWPEQHGRPEISGPNARGWIDFTGTRIDGEAFDGERYELGGFGELLGPTFGLSYSGFVAYQEIEDSEMYQGGMEIGVPIRLLADHPIADKTLLEVRAIPVVQLGAAGSLDAGAGGSLYGVGGALTARVTTPTLTFAAGVQSIWYDGIDNNFEYDGEGFEFNTELEQQVLSVGGSVGWRPVEWMLLDVAYAYHDYRDPAGVSYWGSPSAGVSAVWGNTSLRFSYEADLADRVDTESLSVGLRTEF